MKLGHLGVGVTLTLLTLSLGTAVPADVLAEKQVFLHCASHFDARAKWHDVMGDASQIGAEMAQYRDTLLLHVAKMKTVPNRHLRFGRPAPSFEDRSLTQLTKLVEADQVTQCRQDALCLACRELAPLK